ncbi:hypothetical protein GCM10010334_65370 [Streptomyces finlayi]|uniref:Uncharacterized protein n=1 Tax=Streptomyces finlayi TaxID=67296 RepID=A0A918X492_9ACTN|nr:hypothetical protein GCM10010334_65370 [Streptomyces finlayi]
MRDFAAAGFFAVPPVGRLRGPGGTADSVTASVTGSGTGSDPGAGRRAGAAGASAGDEVRRGGRGVSPPEVPEAGVGRGVTGVSSS